MGMGLFMSSFDAANTPAGTANTPTDAVSAPAGTELSVNAGTSADAARSTQATLPRIVLAAPSSGTGKTTIVCGLLEALSRRNLNPAAFKCGPDYIDPMFHERIVGAKSGNIDLFFTDESTARSLMVRGSEGCGISVVEGVMGYYDGIGATDAASTYRVARALQAPVILIVDARGTALSIAATVKGFAEFREDSGICAVILNRCSKSLANMLSGAIENETGIKVLGNVPSDSALAIESRHLGLVTAGEIEDIRSKIALMADALEDNVDIDALIELANSAPPVKEAPYKTSRLAICDCDDSQATKPLCIALAYDEAFNFYYSENIRMLEDLGAKIVPFSPCSDEAIPKDASALYLGGGYPELYASKLAENTSMLESIRKAIASGMPLIAECGGFMYLQHELADPDGNFYQMLGVIDGRCENTGRLSHFGYLQLELKREGLMGPVGTSIPAHEFHYWHSTDEGNDALALKPGRSDSWPCMVLGDSIAAGYPHVYFPADPSFARRFVEKAVEWRKCQSQDQGQGNGQGQHNSQNQGNTQAQANKTDLSNELDALGTPGALGALGELEPQ